MDVISKAINDDETFCCSLKTIKNVFRDAYATIFLGGQKYYVPEFYHKAIPAKKIKGRIVCCAILSGINIDEQKGCKLYLSFYPIKKEEYNLNHREKFESTVLENIKNWYVKYKNDESFGFYELLVDWDGDKFRLRENLGA